MRAAGCQLNASDLGISEAFYTDAINDARFIRDRFTMLDIAADSGQLESFAANHG